MKIESYFTKKSDVKSIIINLLDKSKRQVNVAVAWFTERTLFDKLLELQKRGVNIEVIITTHEFNRQSSNQFKLIEENGGFFAEIGSDEQLMHMKFCVIDFDIVISGSANWSNRAFKENNEEVTIVEGNYQRANDFITEFDRLKELSGKISSFTKQLEISKALKTLNVIYSLINYGDTSSIQPFIYQLKNIPELDMIFNHLISARYENAIIEINEFRKKYNQLISVNEIESIELKTQINLLSYQIEALQVEKNEAEAYIEQYNHRYILELNPLISKLIALKKKVFEKLKKHGIIDETYDRLDEEFRKRNEEYEKEKRIHIQELSNEDSLSIKIMHREAVGLCHPDSHRCIYEDKSYAGKIFSELTKAYKANDIDKVRFILNELKLGKQIIEIEKHKEMDILRAKLESLKIKYSILIKELELIKCSEAYSILSNIANLDEYFKTHKNRLNEEYNMLYTKYVKNE
jgi:hypothetical protein